MIDIKLLRENPGIIEESLIKRGEEVKILDDAISLDMEWRNETRELNELRKKKNEYAMSREGIDRDILKELGAKISEKTGRLRKLDLERGEIMTRLPNILNSSVPVGKSEEDNLEIKRIGESRVFEFEPKDHESLSLNLDMLDISRASKVSGARFYYLKNIGVKLEFALIQLALDLGIERGYTPMITPCMIREFALFGTGFLPKSRSDIYKIEGENLYLAGTSEVPLAAFHADEILEKSDLPMKYLGFSTCFRTEAGAHGKDTKGIFRTHQFDKLEFFKFVLPDQSWDEFESLLKDAESIIKILELPYRVVNVCSGELGDSASKKYDIEAYLPAPKRYREMISCSNCLDYQSRRLNIRYREKNELKFIHTMNSTALAIGRTIVAIMENYQNEDGSISVPKALRKYMGVDEIRR